MERPTAWQHASPRHASPPRAIARRAFVAIAIPLLLGLRVAPRDPHPTPRRGVDASRVLKPDQLADATPSAVAAFAAARRIPQVLDGIRCHCGCAGRDGNYSLLSCFEGHGMALHCERCQGQARLADRLQRAGKSLDEIRTAIDDRYG